MIVVGNEKGGSGKTTVAMHIAIALMKAGQRVATIDLDSRQKSLTHYLENRRAWAERTHIDLELAVHFSVARVEGAKFHENEAAEFADFDKVITAVQHCHFLVIDTPPHDSYLMRLAHSIADTLVSPLNDSFLDLDVLAMVDPVTFAVTEVSHYAEIVREARRRGPRSLRLTSSSSTRWRAISLGCRRPRRTSVTRSQCRRRNRLLRCASPCPRRRSKPRRRFQPLRPRPRCQRSCGRRSRCADVRSCSTLLTSALALLMLSGCLFIPIPIGMVYSPTTYQKPEGSVTSREEAMTTSPTPLPSTPDNKLAAKKEHQESAKKRQERVECKEQAQKLLSDADRRTYTKECMSKEY